MAFKPLQIALRGLGALLVIVLLPVIIPAAMIAAQFAKKAPDPTPEEVAATIRNFIEGTGEPYDWDDFECLRITDPELEAIRHEAAMAGPRRRWDDADFGKLRELLARTEALAERQNSGTALPVATPATGSAAAGRSTA